jgi:hypothetical protein
MRNATFANVKASIALTLGYCETDTRVKTLCNEAQERLLNRVLDPVGSIVQYRFCSSAYCLVLPRQIQTVLGFSVCGVPGTVRPIWYQFHANGPGQVCPQDMSNNRLIDQGTVVAFNEVNGAGKYIRVYAQSATDAGKKIVLKYYREDTRQKQYSSIGGVVQEGEEITLVAPPAYAVTSTTVMPGGLYGVIKEVTQYPVDLFEYDGVTNTANLAFYEPSETNPVYRKVFAPGLGEMGACGNTCGESECADQECEQTTVTVLARLQHVPVVVDNDSLVIGNLAALKLMAMAIQRELQERFPESVILEEKARAELDGELAAYHGAGQTIGIQCQNRRTFGVGSPDWYGWGSYAW